MVWVHHCNVLVERNEIKQCRPVGKAKAKNFVSEAAVLETSARVTNAKLNFRISVRAFSKAPSHQNCSFFVNAHWPAQRST